MPTYTFNGTSAKRFEYLNGVTMEVSPGESFETYKFLNDDDLTKTADTPLMNSVVASEEVTGLSSTAQSVAIEPETDRIVIVKITGAVTVRPQVDTAEPLLLEWEESEPVMVIKSKGYFDTLRLTGSGGCTVMQYRDLT